jgi:hypothetical protein
MVPLAASSRPGPRRGARENSSALPPALGRALEGMSQARVSSAKQVRGERGTADGSGVAGRTSSVLPANRGEIRRRPFAAARITYSVAVAGRGRLADGAVERLDAPGDLRVGHECRLTRGDIRGERSRELLAAEEQETILRRKDRRHRRARGRVGDQRADGLTSVGRKCGDEDEAATRSWLPASVITAPP